MNLVERLRDEMRADSNDLPVECFVSKSELVQLLEAIETLMGACSRIEETWDISDFSCVQPKLHKGEMARNDSLAADSITRAIQALAKAKELLK